MSRLHKDDYASSIDLNDVYLQISVGKHDHHFCGLFGNTNLIS